MRDARIAELAGKQFNRVSRTQLLGLGLSDKAIETRLATGRLVAVDVGVYAIAPVLQHDEWGRWKAATLTAPGTVLSHVSAAAAWDLWSLPRRFETVTRPGSGGPRRHGKLIAYRSSTLAGECTWRHGVAITAVARTLLDLARSVSDRALARAVREAVRLEHISLPALGDSLGTFRGRRGSRRLASTVARYAGPRSNAHAAELRSGRSRCCGLRDARSRG